MEIKFDEPYVHTRHVYFWGTTSDGRGFTVMAKWNELEGWRATAEDVAWDESEGTVDDNGEIIEFFFKGVIK